MLLKIKKFEHFNKNIDEISKDVQISVEFLKNICKILKY